jgi:hypothetical protein
VFILDVDPDLDFLPIPDPESRGQKAAPDPGSGSTTMFRTEVLAELFAQYLFLKLGSLGRNTQRTLNNIPGSLECLVNLGDVDLSQNQLTKVFLFAG